MSLDGDAMRRCSGCERIAFEPRRLIAFGPEYCESCYALNDIEARLVYHSTVVQILMARSETRFAPWLTQTEVDEMVEAYECGDTAEEFATMLLRCEWHAQEKKYAPTINGSLRIVR